MHNDDAHIGTLLTRREALALLGAGGAASVGFMLGDPGRALAAGAGQSISGAGDTTLSCVVRPQATEGPYFVDRQLDRSDIRFDPTTGLAIAGVPLTLAFNLAQLAAGTCTPLAGAAVDVWQCDAAGVYSGVDDNDFGFHTVGQKFLRGFQATDRNGSAHFTTIYPGWYPGRSVHIHFKIRLMAGTGPYEFTSQLYFDEALTDAVHALAPYSAKGRRTTLNQDDNDYRRDGGARLTLAPVPRGSGYAAAFNVGLDLTDTATGGPDGFGSSGRGRGRGRGPRPPVG